MIYGYVRVSTDHQNIENQHHEIKEFSKRQHLKIDAWITETISSRKELKQRKLGKLLQKIKAGDVIVATEISRLGRNMLEVMGILQNVWKRMPNLDIEGKLPTGSRHPIKSPRFCLFPVRGN